MILVSNMLNRIVLFFIFLGIFSASFAVGAEVQVSEEESAIVLEQFESLIGNIDAVGIFVHNVSLATSNVHSRVWYCMGCICSILYRNGFFCITGCQSNVGKCPITYHTLHVALWIDGGSSLFNSNVS